ncbi:MAG: hypothetical protein ACRC7O_12810 [Fimbriiglobus sp.]
MSLTLQFLLMVEGPANRSEIVDRICSSADGLLPANNNSCKLLDNLIEVWANPDADASRAGDPTEGYLFYSYRVEGTPLTDVEEQSQVNLANKLIVIMREAGWNVIPCANFEDQLLM